MSGAGLAADANGNIYAATGNGTFSQGSPLELGDSILKFNFSNGTLSLADYFTPFNQNTLNGADTDLGSGGVLLLPDQPGNHPHVLVQAGKEGRIYLVDRDKLTTNPANTSQEEPFCSGCSNDPQIVQESGSGQVGGMWSMPAYWNNTTYWWGSGDVLKSIPLSNGLLDFTHITSSTGSYGFPGATPSISANGTSNGIVWSIDSSQYGSPGPGPGPAVLHAHDATNVSRELWNSTQGASNRDRAGNAVKFSVPRIANGKVFIGTSTEVDVYGLLSGGTPTTPTPAISPGSESVTSSVQVTITDGTSGAVIYYTTDGSNPSAASPTHGTHYTGAFTLTSTTIVKAAAVANGAAQSGIATATYTIQPNAISSINYSSGMTSTGLTLSGSASIFNSRLRLTDTATTNEAGSAFFTNSVNVQSFTTDFLFQLTSPSADGFTFAIHGGATPGALGPSGGGLGYGPDTPTGAPGIPNSVAVKFDLFNNAGEGADSTGLYTSGASPTTPFVDMTGSGIDLHSGDIFQVHMSYDGSNLAMTITDTSTQNTFSHTWQVNIPSTVGGSTAFAGFTGGTGGLTAIQEVIDWTYVSGANQTPQAATPVISPAPGTYTNSVTVTVTDTTANATITYTTDGTAPVPGSHGTAITSGGSFTLASSATVKAMASASGFTNSPMASSS
ncbi:MAG: chitobiase/beta-hexosaminidase C-terminal domain-containing protein [Candidatus Acidiferrales bacterium]